jgi:site-specific recombinase XerD
MRTNQRLAQLWLDALATELGASAGTIATYTDDLNCYLVWLDENSLGLNEVGLEHIRDYIATLDQRGYAGSTMARRITVAEAGQRLFRRQAEPRAVPLGAQWQQGFDAPGSPARDQGSGWSG